MSTNYRNLLAPGYEELEELNIKAKDQRRNRMDAGKVREERLRTLTDHRDIKALP